MRVIRQAVRESQPVAISAMTLLEIAQVVGAGAMRLKLTAEEVFRDLENNPLLHILPLTIEIAREVPNLRPVLRDPANCVIAATARVHGLRLLTSDVRIIESRVVSTIG